MTNTILYLSQNKPLQSKKGNISCPHHYLAFKNSENHRMTHKITSQLLKLRHAKNNASWYPNYQNILCWQSILTTIIKIKYCLLLHFYHSISMKPDRLLKASLQYQIKCSFKQIMSLKGLKKSNPATRQSKIICRSDEQV